MQSETENSLLGMEPPHSAEPPKQENEATNPSSSANGFHEEESHGDGSLWGDSDDDTSGASELDREWKRRREQFYNHGYREGISAGKNDSAQDGFNEGFKDSVLAGYKWGLVRGITSALAFLPEELRRKMVESEDSGREFNSLYESVHLISSEAALKLFYDDMTKKKALSGVVNPASDGISDSDVLGCHFQKLQSLLQHSPELNINLEVQEKRSQ